MSPRSKVVVPLAVIVAALLATAGCQGLLGSESSSGVLLSQSRILPPSLQWDWSLENMPYDRSADQLQADAEEHLSYARGLRDTLLAVEGPRTLGNTWVVYDEMLMHIDSAGQESGLLANVHPSEAVRDVAEEMEAAASRLGTELSLSVDLYEAVAAVDLSDADDVTRFAVEKALRDFRLSGVDQPEEVRDRVAALSDEITMLGQDWSRNINDGKREIVIDSVDQLAGLTDDFIANHPPGDDGKIRIDTTYPDYGPVMKYGTDPDVRRRLYVEYNNRAFPENLDVLRTVLEKRYEYAQLLGFDHYADYVTSNKMIGSAAAAHEFIEKVKVAAAAAAERDAAMLLARKRQDMPGATAVADWEKGYYGNLVRAEQFNFDAKEARKYFDFEDVQRGLMELTAAMFDIRYEQVDGLDLWHEDVTAWDVFDDDTHLGRFFLDLHPRDNKYSHAAQFGYREGVIHRRVPVAALVCNFPNPRDSGDGVALMEHGQVSTFFHEFGHLLHTIFAGRQPWMEVAGISTEWDFVEAPSQMLEEWCFDYETLSLFARHYETGETIPREMVANLKRAGDFGKGTGTAHQTFYGALSLNYYNRPPSEVDLVPLMVELRERYSPYAHVDGTHFNASFGHLFGYSAIYYTYKWSEVIAKDMFSRFEDEGILNRRTAREYRERVLEAGGSRPAADLVEEFLGRPYAFDAFERWLNAGGTADDSAMNADLESMGSVGG